VKICGCFFYVRHDAQEAELRQLCGDLRRRHIALCVGLLPLSAGPDGCGQGIAMRCWTPKPARLLPETEPCTLTSLVNQYAEPRRR
jgi:hypothetical protein